VLFRWFWAQERFLFWHALKFEIIGRLGRNFLPSCIQWLQGTCCKQECGGKVFSFLRALVSVYYTTFSHSAIPNINYSAWIARVFLWTTKMFFLIPVVQSLVREFYTPQIFNAPILIRMFGSLDFDKYKSLLYGKPSLRQIPVLWLVLSRSGVCSTDHFHGNVILFWSKAGKFKIGNQNSGKKTCEHCHSSQWKYWKKLKILKFLQNFKLSRIRNTST